MYVPNVHVPHRASPNESVTIVNEEDRRGEWLPDIMLE